MTTQNVAPSVGLGHSAVGVAPTFRFKENSFKTPLRQENLVHRLPLNPKPIDVSFKIMVALGYRIERI